MWANPFDVHCSENPCLETLVTLRFRLQIQAQKDFNHSPLAKRNLLTALAHCIS